MQMEKIKSIDPDNVSLNSNIEGIQRPDTFVDLRSGENRSDKMKDSMTSFDGLTA